MELFAAAWWVLFLGFILVFPLALFMPFYLAAKARGIQNALEDIALQLQLLRAKDEKSIFELAGRGRE